MVWCAARPGEAFSCGPACARYPFAQLGGLGGNIEWSNVPKVTHTDDRDQGVPQVFTHPVNVNPGQRSYTDSDTHTRACGFMCVGPTGILACGPACYRFCRRASGMHRALAGELQKVPFVERSPPTHLRYQSFAMRYVYKEKECEPTRWSLRYARKFKYRKSVPLSWVMPCHVSGLSAGNINRIADAARASKPKLSRSGFLLLLLFWRNLVESRWVFCALCAMQLRAWSPSTKEIKKKRLKKGKLNTDRTVLMSQHHHSTVNVLPYLLRCILHLALCYLPQKKPEELGEVRRNGRLRIQMLEVTDRTRRRCPNSDQLVQARHEHTKEHQVGATWSSRGGFSAHFAQCSYALGRLQQRRSRRRGWRRES